MTKSEYRNYSYFFFFSSIVFIGFLLNVIFNGVSGWKNFVACLVFGVTINVQLRVALLMRQKALESELK